MKSQSISLRGPTFEKLKTAAVERGIGTSELAQQWLAESPALQMSPSEEYTLLQKLITKRRKVDKPCNDLILRMREIWTHELNNTTDLTPPPKLETVPEPPAPVKTPKPEPMFRSELQTPAHKPEQIAESKDPGTQKKPSRNNQPTFQEVAVSKSTLRGSGYNEL